MTYNPEDDFVDIVSDDERDEDASGVWENVTIEEE